MVEAGVGQVGALGPGFEAPVTVVCGVLAQGGGLMLGYLEGLAGRFAEAPGAAVTLPLGSAPRVALAYAGLGALSLAIARGARRAEPWASTAAGWWRRLPSRRRAPATAATVGALALLGWWAVSPSAGPPERLTVSFLDVGQGDATLVQDPTGGAVLFDGGPPEGRVVRRLRAAGVERLGAVVATHMSRDHHGGLAEVLQEFPVDLLLEGGDGTRDPSFRAMLAEADRRGIRRVAGRVGQTLRVGALSVRVLGPPPRGPGPPPEDPNPRAVAAVVSSGAFDLFLSGDAESPSLLNLPLPDVEAMKVSHHGSADPGLSAVLARLRPQVAGIEVGEGNSYGHPTAGTLRALAGAGARVYRTDQQGTISLSVDGSALSVETER